MNNEDKFQISQIEPRNKPIQTMPQKKKGINLASLFGKKNLPKTLVILAIFLLLVAVGAILWGRNSFSKSKVELGIEISEDIASGEEVTVIVKYNNKNRVNLNDANLIIDYPTGTFSLDGEEIFQEQKSLGTIFRKSEGREEFKIRFIGDKEDIKNLTAKLNYQPQNINSRFENEASLRAEINEVLIKINIEGAEKIISGQGISYLVEYENKTEDDLSDLEIRLTYSDDFEFEDAEPNPEDETDNIWHVDSLKSGEKKEIELRGTMVGNEGESKVLEVLIGKKKNGTFLQYSKSEFITKISPSPLLLMLKIKGIEDECNIDPSKRLDYKLEFRNNTDVALEELILKAYLSDDVFDFRTISLGEVGSFDSRENVITWSGGEIPKLDILEPNDSGEVSFSVQLKESMPVFNLSDKNFRATLRGELETLTVPAELSVSELRVENKITCKINSQLELSSKIYYYEPNQGIINIGPVPPEVDKLTTYTVHWQITNSSNDLQGVKVSTVLPQGINWSDYYINTVSGTELFYNERTKEIVWDVGSVPAGTGISRPLYELIFQIGLRPSVNQIGQTPTLLNECSVEGKDIFTDELLIDSTKEKTTFLHDDPKVGINQARVKE